MVPRQQEEATRQVQKGDILQVEPFTKSIPGYMGLFPRSRRGQSNQPQCINPGWPHKATVGDRLDDATVD